MAAVFAAVESDGDESAAGHVHRGIKRVESQCKRVTAVEQQLICVADAGVLHSDETGKPLLRGCRRVRLGEQVGDIERAIGATEHIQRIKESNDILGAIADPQTLYLLLRGLKTLSLRMARHNQNGQRVAEFLASHPAVRRVWYPGLRTHPDHEVARRMMRGFGGVVSFELEADLEGTARQGFAEGAFLAARWIAGKKGMYDFRRVFREIVGLP